MFKKVLVGLDGSRLAETALPYAAELAHAVSSEELILLRVVEAGGSREMRRANKYLQDRASAMVKSTNGAEPLAGRPVRMAESIAVKDGRGKAASSILQFAEHNSVDPIIVSSHGRSGVDRWLMGNVAEKVIRRSDVPVLVVKAVPDVAPHLPGLRQLLVPLDRFGAGRGGTVLRGGLRQGPRQRGYATLRGTGAG